MHSRQLIGVLAAVLMAAGGCGSDGTTLVIDADSETAITGSAGDLGTGTGIGDTGTGADSGSGMDSGGDTGLVDSGNDTGMDTGTHTGTGTDTEVDTGVDTGSDTGVDTGIDTGSDTGVDTGVDTGSDTGVDTGVDTGSDTGADTGPQLGTPYTVHDGGYVVSYDWNGFAWTAASGGASIDPADFSAVVQGTTCARADPPRRPTTRWASWGST